MPRVLALMLAGGRVDELGVITSFRPKATVPFGGLYRIIDFPLSNLMHSGIEQVGLLSQYRSSSIIKHIGIGASWDMMGRHRGITLLPPFLGKSSTDWYKGTADAVFQNLDFIDSRKPDLVLIVSGDHIYHMDYQDIIQFHQDMEADVTLSFVHLPHNGLSRFGIAEIDDEDPRGGRIKQYWEKPEKPRFNWVSMSVYLFKVSVLRDVLEANAKEESRHFGRDILPLLADSYRFFGYKFQKFWFYSRTLEEYWAANMELLKEKSKIKLDQWMIRTNLDHEAIRDRCPGIIGENAYINNARFYNGVIIKGKVENSILFPGVHVEDGAHVKDSILFFDTQVAPGAKVARTITDIGVTIGKEARIGEDDSELTVVGTQAQIPKRVNVDPGSSISPNAKADFFEH